MSSSRNPKTQARELALVGEHETFHSSFRGICPTCRKLCDGVRILRNDKVIARKFCPEHGSSEALISGNATWFLESLTCIKPGSVPLSFSTAVQKGCPWDCGLCPDHEQHTCLPVIEITNHCNLACPICLVDNQHNYTMSQQEFRFIIEGLIEREGTLDTINLSGGEPTVHPQLLELIDIARRPEISRISISTNGIALANDPGLCQALADRDVYVSLQLDALDDTALTTLRGAKKFAAIKKKALDNLEAAGARITLVTTATRGVNELKLGDALHLLLSRESVLSLMVQPASYTGHGRSFGPVDPLDVLTIPKVIRLLAEQSDGVLEQSDFVPLPCSHPSCFALTYLLDTGDGRFVPFPRFVDFDRYLELLANRGTLNPDERLEETLKETIDELWSGADQIPDSARILSALKNTLMRLYPEERVLEIQERLRLGEATVKTIFVHAFMDENTFDLERVRKCCTHYALPDGRLMPACAYNMFYREKDPRFSTPNEEGQ